MIKIILYVDIAFFCWKPEEGKMFFVGGLTFYRDTIGTKAFVTLLQISLIWMFSL